MDNSSNVDPDIAITMAYDFEQKIVRIEEKANFSKMRFIFKDKSEIHFGASPTPNIKATGTKYSISHRFQSSLKEFKPVAGGVEFVFQDGSKLSENRNKPPGHPGV
jgi:hypothetical protein